MTAGAHGHSDVSRHVPMYLLVLAALTLGTLVTVLASRVQLEGAWNVLIALLIAIFKGSLVAAVFMHLKWEKAPSIWWVLGICALFFFALIFLPVITASDLPPQVKYGSWD